MDENLISIIIPTFNRAHLIGETLDSVLAQTYTNWECIVVDDGSTDDTLRLLNTYKTNDNRFKIFERERLPKGAPTCRNIGLNKAKGTFIIFLDSDDYLLPFCLENRLLLFKENPACNFLVFPMGVKSNVGIMKREIRQSESYLIDFLKFELPWAIMCPIWKRDFLIELNGFKEGYLRLNDPELMIRALTKPDVKFNVFNELTYDSVYVPSQMEKNVFKDKILKSLNLFIPDIANHLDNQGHTSLKKHLLGYLYLWFVKFYVPLGSSKTSESLQLIKLFRTNGIISGTKKLSLILRLYAYAIFNFLYRRLSSKLTTKTYYTQS